jgi:glutamyl-tRNA synthetase
LWPRSGCRRCCHTVQSVLPCKIAFSGFNLEKLLWLNGEHLRRADAGRLVSILAADFADRFEKLNAMADLRSPLGERIVALAAQKVKTLAELADLTAPLVAPEPPAVGLPKLPDPVAGIVKGLLARSGGFASSHEAEMELKRLATEAGLKIGDLTQPLRLALTGRAVSIGVFDTMATLPWERTAARLRKFGV